MAENNWKWQEMAEMVDNCLKCLDKAGNALTWLEWLDMAGHGWKLMNINIMA